jgi:hypothetical protein
MIEVSNAYESLPLATNESVDTRRIPKHPSTFIHGVVK